MEEATLAGLLSSINALGYRRISKNIVCTWGTPECEEYLEKIMKDDRGDRAGFPQQVFNLLLKIYLKHGNETIETSLIEEYL